jgi:hypothetical protein
MIRKLLPIVGSAVFLVIAPGVVAGLVPWWISRWRIQPPFFGVIMFRLAGTVVFTMGAVGLLDSFVRFAVQGVGTPVPVFPTRHLVGKGFRLFWRWKNRRGRRGRPAVPKDVRDLIRTMSRENPLIVNPERN